MTFATQGDFAEAGDVTIEFETYDQGISLLTINIAGVGIWPVEISNSNALLLADAIKNVASSD